MQKICQPQPQPHPGTRYYVPAGTKKDKKNPSLPNPRSRTCCRSGANDRPDQPEALSN
ncbi:hypothetical protein HY768_00450 [candidate division TA06 bacterium]|uniref:Uncharacterized protein n=1 Tax=candidate division TA06 bacterium TaxID=2250710 RepID=A0A933IBZ7_UNCT6|nr:hypothetical protein [candidate division TA06 bacterium]